MHTKPVPGRLGLGASARLLFIFITIVLTCLWLSACGGGGGSPPTTPDTELIYGTAASGKAIDGTVSIEDSLGKVVSLPVTAGSGQFSASVNGMKAPYMLKVVSSDGSVVIYSAASSTGRANISPLTQIAMMRVAAQMAVSGPGELYASPARFSEWLGAGTPAAAAAQALSRLMPAFLAGLPGGSHDALATPTYDPFSTAYAIGDAVDRSLDAYPIAFSLDADGLPVATQTDQASGLSIAVFSGKTALSNAARLAIAGGDPVVGGSSALLSALATFRDGSTQSVAATWSVEAPPGVTIDRDGRLSVPALATVASANVTARWFDGDTTVEATSAVTLLPALRPVGIDILQPLPSTTIEAGASTALIAQVRWSDGSVTRPAVTWSWTGDASAVAQLSADGTLRAGKPSIDRSVVVDARFASAGISLDATASLSISHFVRRVVSVSVGGLAAGQQLPAGDSVALSLSAQWNDGTETDIPCAWTVATANGQGPRIAVHMESGNRLVTTSYYIPTDADLNQRAAESDVLTGTYGIGDGSTAIVNVAFAVRPMLKIPTALAIQGVTALDEGASARLLASVTYSDGSTETTTACWASSNPALVMFASADNPAFVASTYASKPSASLTSTVTASRTFTYQDEDGQSVTTTLQANTAIAVNWVEPQLVSISLSSSLDFLKPNETTTVVIQGSYRKLGNITLRPVTDASLNASDPTVAVNGLTVAPASPPASPEKSWVTLTATTTDPATGATMSATRHVTVAFSTTVAKHLLPIPWGPSDPDVQFRAISADGYVDDYTVQRNAPLDDGYSSNAIRRHLPYLSGVTDFAETQSVGTETIYVAAVEQGRVVAIRLEDLRTDARPVPPLALPAGTSAAKSVALVVKVDNAGPTSASRLYVLDTAGAVRQYRLPYLATGPLATGDLVYERQLPGTFVSMSAGAEHLLALRADGTSLTEGSNAYGQVGDPTPGATGWHEAFGPQMQVLASDETFSNAPLTGVTAAWAQRRSSMVATSRNYQVWGVIPSGSYFVPGRSESTATQSSAATKLELLTGIPRSMTEGAYVQADGSVVLRTSLFTFGSSDGQDVSGGGLRYYTGATWLPAALEIVAGRRQVNAPWPVNGELGLALPIVRLEGDALVYVDGKKVTGADGRQLVLP